MARLQAMVTALGTVVMAPSPLCPHPCAVGSFTAPRKAYRHLLRIGKAESGWTGIEDAFFKHATQPVSCGAQGPLEDACQQVFINCSNRSLCGTLWAREKGITESVVTIESDDLSLILRDPHGGRRQLTLTRCPDFHTHACGLCLFLSFHICGYIILKRKTKGNNIKICIYTERWWHTSLS